jgi:hypothetical protein
VKSPSDRYFSIDYFTAATRFREALQRAGGRLEVLPIPATGPRGEKLSIDIGWMGNESPRRVVLHSSGLHGVEGFAGSAIQLQLLDELPDVPEDTALILVHILNPYGMAWLRRFNENNVDLNRNFLSGESYSGAPAAYAQLNSFLNPDSPPRFDLFTLRAVSLILRHGMTALKQPVVGGQYEYPTGLFFGGKRLEAGAEKYVAFLGGHLNSAEYIIALDVHTGLGRFGLDTLLVNDDSYPTVRQQFGERVARSDPAQGPAYRIRGGLDSSLRWMNANAGKLFITQEFGTYSAIKVLHALREENRWHHYGGGALNHSTKQRLKETFCPNAESWRQSVLQRGRAVLKQAMLQLQRGTETALKS